MNDEKDGATSNTHSQLQYYVDLTEKLETVIEFSTDGIYVVDSDGTTILVNKAYEKMTGYNRSEFIGENVAELTKKGYFNTSISKLVFEQKQRLSIIQKIGNPKKIGEKKEVIVTGTPVFKKDNDVSFIVISINDISEISKIKAELKHAKERSEINNHHFSFKTAKTEPVQFIFKSPQMKTVYEKVKQIAPFPTSILLSGPSGVGKEIITDLIHHFSKRNERPLIKINCGAIPEHLLESELFGYEKGAFTGAKNEGKAGLLELADKGTIMFDEIGEMPLNLQVKLLRVIQEKEVQRLGANQSKEIDVRIISVTNKKLEKLVAQGQFREDLYYRLNVIKLDIPPLCDRPEDISELLTYFFNYFSENYFIDKQLSEETKRILLNYDWPGNVRELRNLVEYLIVSTTEDSIEPNLLPPRIIESDNDLTHLTLKERVERYERQVIQDALKQNTSIRQTAEKLGVHHSTLVKKMKKWQE